MNKTAKTLLIIGGVLAILGAIGGLVFTFLFFAIKDAAANLEIAAQLKETIQKAYPDYTPEMVDKMYAEVVNFCATAAYVQLFVTIFTFIAAIVAFVSTGVHVTGLYIACIVLSLLAGNIFILIGGIVAVVKRNEPVTA